MKTALVTGGSGFIGSNVVGRLLREGYSVKVDEDFNMWSIKVPLNFVYRLQLGNSTSALAPFAGFNLRYNLSATIKETARYNGMSESETISMFKSSDMGGNDNTWKRFQLGWQAGLKFIFGDAFMVGVSYGSDFSEMSEKMRLQTTTITLGYCF